MAEERYYLTKGDVLLLRQMLAEYRQRHTPRPGSPDPWFANDHQAPETYYALTPDGGIPALDGDTPGTADCTIYHLVQDPSTLAQTLEEIPNLSRTVYNASGSAIPGSTYITITRDKFGHWVPLGGGTLTVKGVDPLGTADTAITISGVSTLEFDEKSGITVTGSNGTADITLQNASYTHSGVVDCENIRTQYFAGDKVFKAFNYGPYYNTVWVTDAFETSWVGMSSRRSVNANVGGLIEMPFFQISCNDEGSNQYTCLLDWYNDIGPSFNLAYGIAGAGAKYRGKWGTIDLTGTAVTSITVVGGLIVDWS